MKVCTDEGGRIVLATKRTHLKTTAIVFVRGKRAKRVFPNREFDAIYKLAPINPEFVIRTWLDSNIKLTQEVRKELQMFIEVKAGKVVAKHEEMPESPNEKSKFYAGADDIVTLKAADITKLNKAVGGEALVDTDKAVNAQVCWDNMVAYEIPAKAEKAPKEPKEPKAPRVLNRTYTFVKKAEKLPKQAQQILDIIEAHGTISRADLLKEMEGVVQTVQTQERILGFYEKSLADFVTTA